MGELNTVLMTDGDERKDIALVRRAIKERWAGVESKASAIVERLAEIVEKRTVEVVTKQGVVNVDCPADQNAIAAASVLVTMMGQNQRDELAERKANQPQSPAQPAPNVAIQINNGGALGTSETGGITASSIALRIAAGRVSEAASG
jgi:hypothetical protein